MIIICSHFKLKHKINTKHTYTYALYIYGILFSV